MTVALVVLAGGQGRRLGGRIKPLLSAPDGSTLLARVVSILGPLADARFVVAPGALHAALSAAAGDAQLVADSGEGPARALVEAASSTDAEWILMVAADHPAPSLALAERLLAARTELAQGVWVVRDGFVQSTFAVYRRASLSGRTERSLHALVQGLQPRVELPASSLTAEELAGLEDVDEPEDLSRWSLS